MTETATTPKYPEITVQMAGQDGNAFAILGRCRVALRLAGRAGEFPDFMADATSGDYNHLMATVFKWFNVE